MNRKEWAGSDSITVEWERDGFAGLGIIAEPARVKLVDDGGGVAIEMPIARTLARRAIESPSGNVIADDGSQQFETAWEWCGRELPAGTKYGHVWNTAPSNVADLGIPFVDDERAANRTRHSGKHYHEWLKSAELAGDETEYEKRRAWQDGKAKPTKGPRK